MAYHTVGYSARYIDYYIVRYKFPHRAGYLATPVKQHLLR